MTAKPKLVWSPYQKDVFKAVAQHPGDIVVAALAGSSKTTSLVESLRYIPANKKVLVTAFNKEIQKELEKRIKRMNVETRTFHSLGLRAITQNFGKVQIDDFKVPNIVEKLHGAKEMDLIKNVSQIVSFCKASLNDSPSHIETLMDDFGIDPCTLDHKAFISLAIKTLGECKKQKNIINFDDMCWYYFVYNMNVGKYDYVFVDEFQDLNKAQLTMAVSALKPNGKLVFFGDFFQSLYSWRLADTSIIHEILQKGTTKTLPLPVCYRCPIKVIEMAKSVVPNITCPSDTKDGSIRDIGLGQFFNEVKPGAVLLSRTNAPLIKTCMKLLKMGIRCNILGRDIGDGLLYLIKKSQKKQLPAFLKWLQDWEKSEIDRLKAKGMNPENVMDRVECLRNVAEDSDSLEDLKAKIAELFDDTDKTNIVLGSTVHRFKGREADDVYILKWTLKYWPLEDFQEPPDPRNEERNIYYVAITRTKNNLTFINKA